MPTKCPPNRATAQNDRLTSTKHVHRRDPNNPSTTWFYKDWVNDPGVSSSSLAARGLWMEMLAIAASAEPYGDVVINGRPISEVQLARRVGASVEEVTTLLAELEENGVFSRDRKDGRIFSRRMRREAEIVMDNQTMNGPQDNGTADLDLDDLSVTIEFIWDRTDTRDAIIVTPPEGMACKPASCLLELEEEATGTLYLYGWEGM